MVLVQSARQRLDAGETSEAIAQLREAVSLSPSFSDAQLLLARSLRLSSADGSPEALSILQSILAADPRHAEAHYENAVTLEALGRREEALREYAAAAQAAPSLLDARRALAAAASRSQDWCAAAAESRAVLAWEPNDKESQRLLRQAEESKQGSCR
jgi:tetratricopeptide (TPR) repeat protein